MQNSTSKARAAHLSIGSDAAKESQPKPAVRRRFKVDLTGAGRRGECQLLFVHARRALAERALSCQGNHVSRRHGPRRLGAISIPAGESWRANIVVSQIIRLFASQNCECNACND